MQNRASASLQANVETLLERVTGGYELAAQLPNGKLSYADLVKSKGLDKNLKADNSILLYPTDKNSTKKSADLQQDIKSVFNPVEEGIKIKAVRSVGDKGVLIKAAEKEDLNAILDHQKLRDIGLTISRPTKRLPRMALIGVPSDMSDDEIKDALVKLNNFENDEIKEQMKVAFKFGRRDGLLSNVAVEVTPELRKKLKKVERIFMGWTTCRIEDFLRISVCYKCNGLNHVQKTCKAASPTCGHCTEDHETKDCTKKDMAPKCVTCKRFNLKHDHVSNCRTDCPSYANALKGLINRTDYGV